MPRCRATPDLGNAGTARALGVDARESAILVDILRTGGMAMNGRNFPSPEARNAFLEKFNLGYYERQKNEALLRVTDEDADVVEIAYTEALAYGAKIATACREYLPTEWNTKETTG